MTTFNIVIKQRYVHEVTYIHQFINHYLWQSSQESKKHLLMVVYV